MQLEIKSYLDELRSQLHLDPATEMQVLKELRGYFQEKTADLREMGFSVKCANRLAMESCGQPKVLARQIYEAYSKGSWIEAAMASLPHFIVAGLLMLSLWRHMFVVSIVSGLIVCITLYGWWHGKPAWLYPWVGYSLTPLVVGGFISWPTLKQAGAFLMWERGSLPNIWLVLGGCGLSAFSLWIIIRTIIRAIRRDWILASLMLIPLPIIGGWLFGFGDILNPSMGASHALDMSTGIALIVLGVTSIIFIRLRQRKLKAGAVVAFGAISLALLTSHLGSSQSLPVLLLTLLLLLTFLLSPALLEAKIRHGESIEEMWSEIERLRYPSATQSK